MVEALVDAYVDECERLEAEALLPPVSVEGESQTLEPRTPPPSGHQLDIFSRAIDIVREMYRDVTGDEIPAAENISIGPYARTQIEECPR